MREVRTEITLVNIGDAGEAKGGRRPQSKVRRLTVSAVVDTGVRTLIINEATCQKLGLRVKSDGETALADRGTVPSQITEPVMVRWNDRETPCQAIVLPDEEAVLLGALPLEGMDLMVSPLRNEVIAALGDKPHSEVKQHSGQRGTKLAARVAKGAHASPRPRTEAERRRTAPYR